MSNQQLQETSQAASGMPPPTRAERFFKFFAGSDRGHGYTLKPTGEETA